MVPSSKYSIKCPYSMTPKYITIHNTANDATAANEISYMINNNNQVSYHIAVDDSRAIQAIPYNRNAWHAGDGSGPGNRQSVGIEICFSKSGGSRYYAAEKNAADVTAQLMKKLGISISNVVTHQRWSGKYCPHRMLSEGRWNTFINQVKAFYGGSTPTPTPTPSNGYSVGSYQKPVRTTAALNCRSGRGSGYSLLTTFASGATVTVWYIDKASDGSLWGSCSCASKTGYIHMGYTKPI